MLVNHFSIHSMEFWKNVMWNYLNNAKMLNLYLCYVDRQDSTVV